MFFLKLLSSYRFSRYMKAILLLWDLMLLCVTYLSSCFLRDCNFKCLNNKEDQTTFLMVLLIWLVIVSSKDAYKIIRVERIYTTIGRTIKLVFIHLSAVAVFILILNFDDVSRLRMLYFYIAFFILILFFRVLFLKALKYARSQGYNFRKVIIIGANETGERINQFLINDLSSGYKVDGVFYEVSESSNNHTMKILGNL